MTKTTTRKSNILEKLTALKKYNGDRDPIHSPGYEFRSMEDVINTENVTNGITKNLINLCKQSNIPEIQQLQIQSIEHARYFDSNDKVINVIRIINPLKMGWHSTLDLTISCDDGLLSIYEENYKKQQWFYQDITNSDINDLSNYIFETFLLKQLQNKNFNKKVNNRRQSDYTTLKNILHTIQEECDFITKDLPRGKQRSHTESDFDEIDGEVTVQYRMNTASPLKTFCTFYVIQVSNEEIDIVCYNKDNKEIWKTTTQLNDNKDIDDLSFVRKCIFNTFDEFYTK